MFATIPFQRKLSFKGTLKNARNFNNNFIHNILYTIYTFLQECNYKLKYQFLAVAWLALYQSTLSLIACENGVNWKSGRYVLNFLLLAVFLNCPSALVTSNTILPLKSNALTSSSASSFMDTSADSSTKPKYSCTHIQDTLQVLPDKMMGSTSLYSLKTQMNNRAKSREQMNCLKGLPVPITVKVSPPISFTGN